MNISYIIYALCALAIIIYIIRKKCRSAEQQLNDAVVAPQNAYQNPIVPATPNAIIIPDDQSSVDSTEKLQIDYLTVISQNPPPTRLVSNSSLVDNEKIICQYCFEYPNEINLQCGHKLCRDCTEKWVLRKRECPKCREKTIGIQACNSLNSV